MDGAFAIYYFIGDFPGNVQAYRTAPTLAGINHVFVAPAEACDNCARQKSEKVLVRDTNPMTPILFDYQKNGKLANLHPEDVVPFLRTNLHWRVVGVCGFCFALVSIEKLLLTWHRRSTNLLEHPIKLLVSRCRSALRSRPSILMRWCLRKLVGRHILRSLQVAQED